MGDGFYRSKDPTNRIKVLKRSDNGNNNNGTFTLAVWCAVVRER